MSGHNWSLRWSYYSASQYCLLDVLDSRTMETLSLRICIFFCCKLYFLFSIFAYNALLLGLRYRQLVTLKRTYLIVANFWIMSAVASISFLGNHLVALWYGYLVIPLCLVTSIASYTKIFLKNFPQILIKHKYRDTSNKNTQANLFHWT